MAARKTRRLAVLLCLIFTCVLALAIWLVKHDKALRVKTEETKQIVSHTAQMLEGRRRQGFRLPEAESEWKAVLGGEVPGSAWGEPIRYQRIGASDFILFAISPYPEWWVIEYDSRKAEEGILVFPF